MDFSKRPALHNDEGENVKRFTRKNDRHTPTSNGSGVTRLERRSDNLTTDWRVEQIAADHYFTERANRIASVATTRTPRGQVLDWIDPRSQRPDGKIATPPPQIQAVHDTATRADRLIQFELDDPHTPRGPKGTVPVMRREPQLVRVSTTLQALLSKHHLAQRFVLSENDVQQLEVPGDGAHDYAYTAQFVTCYGGAGYLSAYDPYVQWSDEFSLLQILLRRSNQTIEAGWQEFRDLYGDWVPHLFVYYTTNGYTSNGDNIGGYNRDVDGWVQYSDTVFPGAISSPNSVRGGDQYTMQIKYQLYQGNWWLNCNNQWIGYYPASLFSTSGLQTQAEKIAFYGEIVDAGDQPGLTNSDMGSGYWPEYEWPWSAYLRNLQYQSDIGGSMTQYNASIINASDPDQYDLIAQMNSGTTWDSYVWLGGPGNG